MLGHCLSDDVVGEKWLARGNQPLGQSACLFGAWFDRRVTAFTPDGDRSPQVFAGMVGNLRCRLSRHRRGPLGFWRLLLAVFPTILARRAGLALGAAILCTAGITRTTVTAK